jgi:hypothetical protein
MLTPPAPDPTLSAMTGLIAWGVQADDGPLSGLNVVLQSASRWTPSESHVGTLATC